MSGEAGTQLDLNGAAPEEGQDAAGEGAPANGAGDASGGGEGGKGKDAPAAGDAGAPASWRDSIADEKLRKHAERFASPADAIKANLESRQRLSRAIVPPGKDATPEDIADFHKKIGVPEKPDGYEFPAPAEGEGLSEEEKAGRSAWASQFHALGVPKATGDAIIKMYFESAAKARESMAEADKAFAAEAEAALKKEWGSEYEENVKFASMAASNVFGDDFEDAKGIETKEGRFLLDHPVFLRMFARLGREMDEGHFLPAGDAEAGTLQEKADEAAQKKYDALAKGDQAAAQKWDAEERNLLAKIHGDGPVVGTIGRQT